MPERPAHPGDQRRDDVADRFVVVPRDEVLEPPVQLRQLAVDQPADGPAARQLHGARGSRQRAYVLNVSTSWRCASVQIVSNTSDDLPAAADAGERDQPVLRNVDVDALEVVRAGASDFDRSH